VNVAIRTDPPANTPVAKGAKVTLVVSAGPAKVKVPPVEGLTEAAARNQLTNRGLVADVQYVTVAIGSPDDGHVISQNIPPTESVDPGTTIRLKVGKAAPAPTTTTSTTLPPTTTTPPTADLSITMTSTISGSSPKTVTYTIIVRNNGPFDVTGARVTDDMSNEPLNSITWTCSDDAGANCPAAGSNNIDAAVSMSVGTTVTFEVKATVTATSGSLSNTATVTSPTAVSDPTSENNSATDTRTLNP
jgi:hypothetical protein